MTIKTKNNDNDYKQVTKENNDNKRPEEQKKSKKHEW